MKSVILVVGAAVAITICSPSFILGQAQTTSTPAQAKLTADYPRDRTGVLIQNVDWLTVNSAMPAQTKTKRGLASSMSYGAVAAVIVSEYVGEHAEVQVAPGQPILCICHILSLPGEPVLVRLHPKKGLRELDGGRIRALPLVGGNKIADANKSDLVLVDVSQPESMVWLVHPQEPLAAGEYALMLGTQNINIFPFTVASSPASPPDKH